jgi:hypothetical protein
MLHARSSRYLAAFAILILGALMATPTRAGILTSPSFLPLNNAPFFVNYPTGSPCTGEYVVLSGNVHVVTLVQPSDNTADIYFNAADISGMGQTSGTLYLAIGAAHLANQSVTLPGTFASSSLVSLTLQPTNGCASVALPLGFSLTFDSLGNLDDQLLHKRAAITHAP